MKELIKKESVQLVLASIAFFLAVYYGILAGLPA